MRFLADESCDFSVVRALARKSRVAAQRYNGFSTGGEILRDQEAICAAPLGLYFGICTAPQSHRIITALCREAGAAQKIAERSKKSRTAGPTVGRVSREARS